VSVPSIISAITPAVHRNGLPRMIGTSLSFSIYITMKSPGIKNLPTYTDMSSTILSGNRTEPSGNWIFILMDFSSLIPIYSKIVRGMRLALAPRS
jgi:hypothetical protein